MELVEKYKDILDTEFVPLECVREELLGCYEINKLGQVKTVKTGKIRSTFSLGDDGYPRVNLGTKGDFISPRIHILLAKTFIPNPDNKPYVDHINHDRSDFRLENLRWVTPLENNLNRSTDGRRDIFFIKLDESGKEIERFHISEIPENKRDLINESIRDGWKYKGHHWKRLDPIIEEYITKYGEPKEDDWRPCLRFPEDLECNLNGMIRRNKKVITIGNINRWGYRKLSFKNHEYSIHRLVYETFSGELLSDKDVIDHISTVRDDNRYSNLRKCSQSENMLNPITNNKSSKTVYLFSEDKKSLINSFSSANMASKSLNISRSQVYQFARSQKITKFGIFSYNNFINEQNKNQDPDNNI
jgi:hypothetical protein